MVQETGESTPGGEEQFKAPETGNTPPNDEGREHNAEVAHVVADRINNSMTEAAQALKDWRQAEEDVEKKGSDENWQKRDETQVNSYYTAKKAQFEQEYWHAVTQYAQKKGLPLPLTSTEKERIEQLTRELGPAAQRSTGIARRLVDRIVGRNSGIEELRVLQQRRELYDRGGLSRSDRDFATFEGYFHDRIAQIEDQHQTALGRARS